MNDKQTQSGFNFLYSAITLIVLTGFVVVSNSCQPKGVEQKQSTDVTDVPPSLKANPTSSLISLNEQEAEELNIQVFTVTKKIHSYSLDVPGVVFPAPNYYSIISTPLSGRVVEMRIREGEKVGKGDILFRIESLELGVLVSEYIQAVADEEYYMTRFERIRQLSDKQITSASELDKAESDLKRVRTITRAAYSKLRAAGIPEDEIQGFIHKENIEPVLNLRSPISGTFGQRNVDLGQRVSAYEALGTVIDNRYVWIRGYLAPEDGRLVNPGDTVFISRRNQGETSLVATVSTVNPGLDESNRSAIINIFLKVPGLWPRPGENVRLTIRATSPGAIMAVPLKAVTYDGNDPVVFVRKDIHTWEERKISVREFRDTSAIVLAGIVPGEKVAVSQVFSLKALARYEQIAEE